MIVLNVILKGQNYRLPNIAFEEATPMLKIIRKGIMNLFRPVVIEYPHNKIIVTWDDDKQELIYDSDTIIKTNISKILREHHGMEY
jgi:hypothetical protein